MCYVYFYFRLCMEKCSAVETKNTPAPYFHLFLFACLHSFFLRFSNIFIAKFRFFHMRLCAYAYVLQLFATFLFSFFVCSNTIISLIVILFYYNQKEKKFWHKYKNQKKGRWNELVSFIVSNIHFNFDEFSNWNF